MKTITILLGLLLISVVGNAQEINWKTDYAHSEIQFIADYMVFIEITGEFEKYDIRFISKGDDFSKANIEFKCETASINTGEAQRDGHLKSPDFFDVEKHPQLTFKSVKITKVNGNKYKMVGDLTMRGVTKQVEFEVTHKGTDKGPYGNVKAGFRIKGAINRYDWGLKWNATLETGGLLVSELIEIVCNVTLIREG